MFALVPILSAAVFAGAWLLAGDLFGEADQECVGWAYSRIDAASMVGGMLGGAVARQLCVGPRFDRTDLLAHRSPGI